MPWTPIRVIGVQLAKAGWGQFRLLRDVLNHRLIGVGGCAAQLAVGQVDIKSSFGVVPNNAAHRGVSNTDCEQGGMSFAQV